MKNTLILATTALALSAASAVATPVTWNLVGPTSQLLGPTDTLVSTTGNISLVFSGFVTNTNDIATSNTWLAPSAQASALFAKHGGGDEVGLGLAADPTHDNEIFKNSFIQIDLTGLLAQKSITALQLVIGSVQTGEGFNIWGSNTAKQPGSLLYSGNSTMDDIAFSVPQYGSFKYVAISATAHNILLDSVTGVTSAAPEPSTLGLFLMAGLSLAAMKVGRKKSS